MLDQAAMSRRFCWLAMYGAASDPQWSMSALLLAERERLDAKNEPIADKLAALEQFLDEHGLLAHASRFADRFTRTPARTRRDPKR